MTAPEPAMKSANRITAERMTATARAAHPCLARSRRGCLCIGCREFRAAARDVLETMGIIEPGGDVVLPDFGEENPDTPIAKARAAARREREREGPHQLIARPPRQETVPTGLRALPPAPPAPAAKKSLPPHDGTRLGRDLAELEAANPKVAAAARSLEETVQRINGRPRPTVADLGLLKPPQPEHAPEPVVPATRKPPQPPVKPAPGTAAADGPAVAGTTAPPRKKPGPKQGPIAHGTYNGAQQHYRRKVPIPADDPCGCGNAKREAKAAQLRRRRERHRQLLDAATAVLAQQLANPPVLDPIAEEFERLLGVGVDSVTAATVAPLGARHRPPVRGRSVTVPSLELPRPGPAATVTARPLLPTDLDAWLATAGRHRSSTVRKAATRATARLDALREALDDLARVERVAGRRTA